MQTEESMRHLFHRLLAIPSVAVLTLAACSAHRQLARQAVDFNLTVEKAQNEMLLLNVIRAKERLPLYLTGISNLTGSVETAFTAGLTGTYTGERESTRSSAPSTVNLLSRSYTPSLGATLTAAPTFTLTVLDTQEFMRGFLDPLGKETLAFFWSQGWPPELLVYLLVQQVEISEDGKPTRVLRNHPDSADPDLEDLKSFAEWVHRDFLAQSPEIEEVSVPVSIGPELAEAEVANLNNLVAMAKEGLVLEKVEGEKDRYQLQKQGQDVRFHLASNAKVDAEEPKEKQPYFRSLAQKPEKMGVSGIGSKSITFALRSPEAVLYYLGELTRLANRKDPLVPLICIQGQFQPLFLALPAGACSESLVDADTGRERFSIPPTDLGASAETCDAGALRLEEPACESGRSMQAISLLGQLISLQKSAKDLPSTSLVRVIGD
jgi:hypothetical protein